MNRLGACALTATILLDVSTTPPAAANTRHIDGGILGRECMPALTGCPPEKVFANAGHVHYTRDRFQVGRSDTPRMMAEMVDFPSCWNGPLGERVGQSLGRYASRSANAHLSVARVSFAAQKLPAVSAGHDHFRESDRQRRRLTDGAAQRREELAFGAFHHRSRNIVSLKEHLKKGRHHEGPSQSRLP